jgi:hypothetical protein
MAIEYLCEVAHAQARYLGWLGADERAWDACAERDVSRERVARFGGGSAIVGWLGGWLV